MTTTTERYRVVYVGQPWADEGAPLEDRVNQADREGFDVFSIIEGNGSVLLILKSKEK